MISGLFRERFSKEEFKANAYDFLTQGYKEIQNQRVQAFRETRKLFIRNLVDRITDEIWPETQERTNLYFLIPIAF